MSILVLDVKLMTESVTFDCKNPFFLSHTFISSRDNYYEISSLSTLYILLRLEYFETYLEISQFLLNSGSGPKI